MIDIKLSVDKGRVRVMWGDVSFSRKDAFLPTTELLIDAREDFNSYSKRNNVVGYYLDCMLK
jgi:hypothetical protein